MSTDMREFSVVKTHPFVQATYSMTVWEQRILLSCISQIDSRYPIDNKTFTLTVEQARDLFYTDESAMNVYRDMKRAVEKLWTREVKIAINEFDVLQTRFIQSIVWADNRQQITLKFADDIKPYISEIQNNFSGYKLKNIVQLTSSYAIRIYEMLVSWVVQNQLYKEFEITEFREMLGIGEKYRQIGELKARIIAPAVEQINAKTDLSVDVAFKKCGREVRWIQLRFNQKADAAKLEAERKAARETRAIQNQAAKAAREEREQEAAKAAELSAAEQAWAALPKDAKFLRHDGTRWEKQGDFFRCVDEGRTANPAVAAQIWAEGFFKLVDDWRE